jgi:hypothetical protein
LVHALKSSEKTPNRCLATFITRSVDIEVKEPFLG